MTDFWIMLIKAPVFGILIGVTGCYEGMRVRQNAEEVGQRTTSAVFAAFFLVIVLYSLFAVFFSSLGFNLCPNIPISKSPYSCPPPTPLLLSITRLNSRLSFSSLLPSSSFLFFFFFFFFFF